MRAANMNSSTNMTVVRRICVNKYKFWAEELIKISMRTVLFHNNAFLPTKTINAIRLEKSEKKSELQRPGV